MQLAGELTINSQQRYARWSFLAFVLSAPLAQPSTHTHSPPRGDAWAAELRRLSRQARIRRGGAASAPTLS
jgi:hypothetical protein